MKKIIFSVLILLTIFSFGFSQEEYTDDIKDFTFTMPEDWVAIQNENLKYKIIVGDRIDNFTQNIIINTETFDGGIDTYIQTALDLLKTVFSEIRILKQEEFENDNNIESYKFIAENKFNNKIIRQYYYIFKNENKYFIVIASVTKEISEEIEEIFDASMSTFKFLPKSSESVDKFEKVDNSESAESTNAIVDGNNSSEESSSKGKITDEEDNSNFKSSETEDLEK